jgi:hypothetical protein
MKTLTLAVAFLLAHTCLAADGQPSQFLPGHLAVLRAGDGALDLRLKQAPVFIDQFDATMFNNAPSFTVKVPTNGPGTLFFNGHAATEGTLSRSADHKLLSFAGYSGVNLLQTNGTPSLLDIERAFCTVDAAGTCHTAIYKVHSGVEKMNPRGVVTDGTNNFWGCGNANGTVYYNTTGSAEPVEFKVIPSSRAVRIINNILYAAINGADGNACDQPAGIFSFEDEDGHPTPLPRAADVSLKSVVKLQAPYTRNAGFDINPAGTVAYVADTSAGVQKYVKSGDSWKFAYSFSIPQVISAGENHAAGCFGLVADFSGAAPIIFATTTEGYNGSVNSNRVVRIVDTNATAAVTTLAQAGSVKIAFRGIDFTPVVPPVKP